MMTVVLDAIREYQCGPDRLEASVAGLSPDSLHARPGPGKWSIHEVVIHLMDSDAISIERMKRITAMESPTLLNYDESAFIERLYPASQSLEDALLLFRVNRRQWCRTLHLLTLSDFDRVGYHSVSGPVTLGVMVRRYVDHLAGHLTFIHQKRVRLGVPVDPGVLP